MTQHVRDVMTANPVSVEPVASVASVARVMRDENVGAVLVAEEDRLRGLVSDRDLVVRVLAEGGDPERTSVAEACSKNLVTVGPDDELRRAVEVMRENAVRRVPVVDGERHVVGVVALADLAIERDPESALGDISAARPNR